MFVVYYYKNIMEQKFFEKYLEAENFALEMAGQGYTVNIDRI